MSGLRKKLKEFLSGKDNLEGRALYDAWYKSFNDKDVPVDGASPEDVERELARIKLREAKRITVERSVVSYWRVAAAVLLLAAVGITLYISDLLPFIGEVRYAEYVTADAQRLQVNLPDGTVVWLNADTKLRTPGEFDGDMREVFLEGEAFFDVTHDPHKPFIIRAGQVTTTVLGTSFNVRNYTGEFPEVAVVTGKVSVHAANAEVILSRGERALVSQTTIGKDMFGDFDRYEAWKDGKLVFEDRTVSEVVLAVSRYYGIGIKLKDPELATCRISTTLDSMPEQEAINLLCLILKGESEKKGSTYWITGTSCN